MLRSNYIIRLCTRGRCLCINLYYIHNSFEVRIIPACLPGHRSSRCLYRFNRGTISLIQRRRVIARVFGICLYSVDFYRLQGKVMFLHLSVLSSGFGRPPEGRPPLPRQIPLRQIPCRQPPLVLTSNGGHCRGRYASYWNAFLFGLKLDSRWIIFKMCENKQLLLQKDHFQ